MAPRIVATLLGHVRSGDVPGAGAVREFFGILLEVKAGGDQPVGNRLVGGVIGEIDLPVAEKASAAMNAEIGTCNHSQIVGIGRMKQSVKISETGAACGQRRKAWIL